MRNAPPGGRETRKELQVICPTGKEKFFRHNDWTAQISLKRLENFNFTRNPKRPRGMPLRYLAPSFWAHMLSARPNVIPGAPVPLKSSAVAWVTIPSGEVVTLTLQNRRSSDIAPGVCPSP